MFYFVQSFHRFYSPLSNFQNYLPLFNFQNHSQLTFFQFKPKVEELSVKEDGDHNQHNHCDILFLGWGAECERGGAVPPEKAPLGRKWSEQAERGAIMVRVVLTMIILFKVEMKAKVEEMKEVVALLAKTEEEVFAWYFSQKRNRLNFS